MSYVSVSDQISSIVLQKPASRQWLIGVSIAFILFLVLMFAVTYLLVWGVGIWGVNVPVVWGWAIVNFVWWIGIGHAGTFISAILLLLHQQWRNSINRFAEAMTIFAVACAAIFPLMHMGRPWYFYWLLPYPNTMTLWPQFRSPLLWDVFAILTYGTVSVLFWYIGLVPDLATMRDRAQGRLARILYGFFALGWRDSASHWHRYETAYLILAGLATPLVISVHSIVSLDFSATVVPGWHSTIFPPYFVAGAIFSGFAMVLTLAIPLRQIYRLHEFITLRHLDNCAKLLLTMSWIVAYGYIMEIFMAWYSGDRYERFVIMNRALGPYWPYYMMIMLCNVLTPQALWFKRIRTSPISLFILSLLINLGMWIERYVIIVTSLHRDFLPSSWAMYHGTIWDIATFIGTLGLFLLLFLLFLRFLPVISIFEVRELAHEKKEERDV